MQKANPMLVSHAILVVLVTYTILPWTVRCSAAQSEDADSACHGLDDRMSGSCTLADEDDVLASLLQTRQKLKPSIDHVAGGQPSVALQEVRQPEGSMKPSKIDDRKLLAKAGADYPVNHPAWALLPAGLLETWKFNELSLREVHAALGSLHRPKPNFSLHSAGSSLFGVIGGMIATMTINLVDVVWIMPFIGHRDGLWNATFYMLVMALLVIVSIIINTSMKQYVAKFPAEHAEKTIDLCTGFLLLLYAAYLFLVSSMTDSEQLSQRIHSEAYCAAPEDAAVADLKEPSSQNEKYTATRFALLLLIGSVDQVVVYVPLLESRSMTEFELTISALLSASMALVICFMLGKASIIANFIESIPLWLIVGGLAGLSFAEFATG
eukprot:TRINITY_DN39812_c0_g1_i1.p1 TRINITY_DN39812_c0_g1~~TRINITY_DN39812_c0_g1_i1.p1  ORF type:complete len:381 (-),score=67.74 TRINITY_DN39812_c0_g1_i1:447-1589(-)